MKRHLELVLFRDEVPPLNSLAMAICHVANCVLGISTVPLIPTQRRLRSVYEVF